MKANVESIREFKTIRGITSLQYLGRHYLEDIEEKFGLWRRNQIIFPDGNDGVVSLYQDRDTGVILYIENIYGFGGARREAIRYAFLTNDGKTLVDPEYLGEIRGRDYALQECLRILTHGLEEVEEGLDNLLK